MEKHEIVVAGAGLTGLSFAYHYNPAVPVFEKESQVGGLVRTIDFNGCKFDLAPHLLHLRIPYVRDLVFQTLLLKGKSYSRKAHIYYDQQIIPYPFELNLFGLKEQTKKDCIDGLSHVNHLSKEEEQDIRKGSYRDYVLKAFGHGIANHYLLPYNRKIWDTEPAEMSCEFMYHIATADKDQIIKNASSPNEDKFGYNTEFFYPYEGIQQLANVFADKLSNIQLNTGIKFFETKEKILHFENGNKIGYEKLISTVPLNVLIKNSDREDLKTNLDKLIYTSVYTINIVIDGKVPDTHWMYFPGNEFSFYRISFPKNYFKKSTPGNEQILAVEVGSRNHSLDAATIEKKVVEEIIKIPIFEINKIHFVHSIKIPVAYCIYDFNRSAVVPALVNELAKTSVISAGRYGNWEYSGMQDAIMFGKNIAEKISIHI